MARKLPVTARKIPKGTRKSDYEPEVIAEYERGKRRMYKANQRKREKHRGERQVTVVLGQDARAILTQLCRERGMSKATLLTHLLNKEHTHGIPQPVPSRVDG